MESNTSRRLKEYMAIFNVTQADILKKCQRYCEKYGVNMSRASLSQYVTGIRTPKSDRIYVLSKALNVSPAWLMGYDVPMELTQEDKEDKNEVKMLFASLNYVGQKKALEYMRDLADNEKYLK